MRTLRAAYRKFDEVMAPFVPLLILYLLIYVVAVAGNVLL